MISLKRFSIKRKLVAIQLLTTSVVLLACFVFFMVYDVKIGTEIILRSLTSTATLIGSNSTSALTFLDNRAAEEVLSSLESEVDITNAWIYDNNNRLFAKYSRPGYEDFDFPKPDSSNSKKVGCCFLKRASGFPHGFITISRPISGESENLGMLSLRLNEQRFHHMIVRGLVVTLIVLFLGMGLALGLAILTQKSISQPILNLANAGQSVIETGDYSVRVEKMGQDEIGALYDDFNRLMEQIQVREGERDRAYHSLRKSEERFKTLVSNIPGATYRCLMDRDWTMEFISDEIENISGYPPADFIQNNKRTFASIIYPEDALPVEKLVQKAVGNRSPYEVEYRIMHLDGSIRWVSERGQGVYDGPDKLLWLDGTIFDITKRKSVERTAKRQQEKLIQTDKMTTLGILVSGVAHEINNPNNFMLLNSNNLSDIWTDLRPHLDKYLALQGEFLVSGMPYSEVREEIGMLLGGIAEGSERIRKIVESLKDFARKDQGGMNQQVQVNTILESALIILSNLIKKSTDDLIVEYDPNLPTLSGNGQQIEQVIINLISNSCQSLEKKDRSIKITTSFDASAGQVVVVIRDQGRGISKDNMKHIMDPFFTTKRDSGGTGLGLSISYTIIKDHGGELKIESEEGSGTRATIILPINRAQKNGLNP